MSLNLNQAPQATKRLVKPSYPRTHMVACRPSPYSPDVRAIISRDVKRSAQAKDEQSSSTLFSTDAPCVSGEVTEY